MVDCGCSPAWLIEQAEESLGAWDRRVTGTPVVGDMHPAQNRAGWLHLFNGFRWIETRP